MTCTKDRARTLTGPVQRTELGHSQDPSKGQRTQNTHKGTDNTGSIHWIEPTGHVKGQRAITGHEQRTEDKGHTQRTESTGNVKRTGHRTHTKYSNNV